MPAAALHGLSIGKNVTSYKFSKILVNTVFQGKLEMGVTRIGFFWQASFLIFFKCGEVQRFIFFKIFPWTMFWLKKYAGCYMHELPRLRGEICDLLWNSTCAKFPNFCWTVFLAISTNFLQYIGVSFGYDLLPTVTPAVIHLCVSNLPFYASIPARTTEEWHWIMSSQSNAFSVKEIYFDNLRLWTLRSTWMTGPLFLWPLVAGSRWFH